MITLKNEIYYTKMSDRELPNGVKVPCKKHEPYECYSEIKKEDLDDHGKKLNPQNKKYDSEYKAKVEKQKKK
ncbi:unnamed protein product [Oppiella nova]|uniref:Uncharacterized protein n=1 Tax=Oppiella nova TaxID=334625 RepID=A0A7R9MAB1_9ACAR|nr:unnamed protein product [Oppiella nova]CAG2173616.1 unnamed protein product [Oppiella nova]